DFFAWQQQHPDNPMGAAAQAAGLLFSEFQRLGILESEFYAKDASFNSRPKYSADRVVRDRFYAAVQQAETLARQRLSKNAKDRDALFAMTLSSGLRGDYAAMIDKRNLDSLRLTKQANEWARQVLAVDPTCYD